MSTGMAAKPTVSERSLDRRQRLIHLTARGASARAIAAQLGCSLRTVYRWRARHRRAGDAGLAYRTRRPRTAHPQTADARLVARIRAIRQAHPGWGARLIRRQLRLDGEAAVPSERTIHAWLTRLGVGRARPAASKPLGWPTPAPDAHDTVWEVDFKQKGAPAT
jgi:transposase